MPGIDRRLLKPSTRSIDLSVAGSRCCLEEVSLKSGRGRVKNVRSNALAGAEGISSKVHCLSTSKLQTQLLWKIVLHQTLKPGSTLLLSATRAECRAVGGCRCRSGVKRKRRSRRRRSLSDSLKGLEDGGIPRRARSRRGVKASGDWAQKCEMCLDQLGSSQ
jgi:hypothetical protein